MKIKKILSAFLASAMIGSALPAVNVSAADYTPANDIFTAIDLSFNEVVDMATESGISDHWYKVNMPTDGKINMTVTCAGYMSEPTLTILNDDDENSVITSSTFSFDTSKIFNYYLPKGNYYFKYTTGSRTSNIKFKLLCTEINTTLDDSASNNNINKASAIELDTDYEGFVGQGDVIDYYTFNVPDDGDTYMLDFEGSMNAVDWELYNNLDKKIDSNTYKKKDSDDIIVSKNTASLSGGKYTLAIKANSTNYGTYKFNITSYNPDPANGLFAPADVNRDGFINSTDASLILAYYSYLSTGGTEENMNKWLETNKNNHKNCRISAIRRFFIPVPRKYGVP